MSKDLALFKDFWENPTFFNRSVGDLFSGFPEDFSRIMDGKCDFEELDDKYVLELEVPGVKKDEIQIDMKNERLTISWSRTREKNKGLKKKTNYERNEGSFTRSFSVEGADTEKVSASLKNGVLEVTVPKKEHFQPKRIEIN